MPALVVVVTAASSFYQDCRTGASLTSASPNCLTVKFDPPPDMSAVVEIPASAPVIPVSAMALANIETVIPDGGMALADDRIAAIPDRARQFSSAPPTAIAMLSIERYGPSAAATLTGAASMYNPYDSHDEEAGGAQTASGEAYDPDGWTAAIQIDLRGQFGGVRYGRNYRPTFALVESGGRRAIVKINDVGPLRPGRIIDFNERTMRYFDPTLQRGVIADVRVIPLAGGDWTPGPVQGEGRVSLAIRVE